MTEQTMNQEQESIMESLNCEWDDVVLQFGDQTFGQIKAELEKMFSGEDGSKLAREIVDELGYQTALA